MSRAARPWPEIIRRLFDRMMAASTIFADRSGRLTLIMEPNQRFDLQGSYKTAGWSNGEPFQPRTTMAIPVDG